MNSWPTFLLEFWTATASHLWQSTIVIALLGLLALTLRKAPGRIRNGLWQIGLLKLAIPFAWISWGFEKTGLSLPRWLAGSEAVSQSVTVDIVSGIWSPVILTAPPENAISRGTTVFLIALTIIWAVAALWLLARSIAAWRNNRRCQGTQASDLDPTTREKLRVALDGTGISLNHIQLSRDARAPGVAGFLRPLIRLSVDMVKALPQEALQAVLLHEEAHRRRYEPLRYGVQRGVFCLFFYFPPLWLLLRQLHDTAELACDEAAMDNGTNPATYLATLRQVVELDLAPATSLAAMAGARPSSFARRLSHIYTYARRPVMLKHRIALLAGIVILSVSFFLAGGPESDKGTVAYVDHPAWLQLAGLTGLNTPVILRFTETELQKIIQALGDATGTDVELMCDGTREVSIDLENTSMGEALVYLAAKLGLHYSVKPSGALIVKGPLLPGVGDVTNPVKRDYNYVPPTYPDAARKDLVEGSVILQTTIGADGTLTDLILLREDPPDYGFSESAMEAVRQWQYEPATLDGIPVPVYLTINVQFSLD